MGFLSNLRALFIPNKAQPKVTQPAYGNDMRVIEIWAAELIKAIETIPGGGGGGGYASLTGPGQTVTPGDLTQNGNFTIDNNTGAHAALYLRNNSPSQYFDAYANVAAGQVRFDFINLDWTWARTGLVVNMSNASLVDSSFFRIQGQGVQITTVGAGASLGTGTHVDIFADTNGVIQLAFGSGQGTVSVNIGGHVKICDTGQFLGFFGHTPVGQQSSSGVTTVAQLITLLQAYGLIA